MQSVTGMSIARGSPTTHRGENKNSVKSQCPLNRDRIKYEINSSNNRYKQATANKSFRFQPEESFLLQVFN
jgi:hypothetical protein